MRLFPFFSVSDEQAMWRVRMQDDEEAFAMLVERWEGPIQNLCTRMLGDSHRGEDLAQDAFSRIFARRREYVPNGKFSTFLWRIALNLCYDELRKRNRRRESSFEGACENGELDCVTDDLAPDISLVRDETAIGVRASLQSIPEMYRAVLILRHYEDLKFREIAEVLGIPEGTVKSRMAEGLTQLAQLMEEKRPEKNVAQRHAKQGKELLVL